MSTQNNTFTTIIGEAKFAADLLSGNLAEIVQFAVGDGAAEPDLKATTLQNEKYRANIFAKYQDPDRSNVIVIESVIPLDVGGFTIREIGFFNEGGDLVAIGKTGESRHYTVEEGGATEETFRTFFKVVDAGQNAADAVNIVIDPTIAPATRAYVDQQVSAYHSHPTNSRIAEIWRHK